MGILHYILDIEVSHTVAASIILSQQKFIKIFSKKYTINVSQSTCTSLLVHLKLTNMDGELLSDLENYKSLVGMFNYLTNTRPDLSYTV